MHVALEMSSDASRIYIKESKYKLVKDGMQFSFFPQEGMMQVTGVAGSDRFGLTHSTALCRAMGKDLETYYGKKFSISIEEQREIWVQLTQVGKFKRSSHTKGGK
jgi:hypothetical protein